MPSALRNSRRPDTTGAKSKVGRVALISLVGTALLTALLFLAAAICLHNDATGWFLPLSAYLCCAVSSFPVGCFAAKAVGKSGLLCGLAASLPLCLLLLILCLALYGSVGSGFLIGAALILLCGALGGFAILNHRHKRRYR
jgi:putative membrane protein (TIGR04086 family)